MPKLELAIPEEHGLTLRPEKQPWRGSVRNGPTNWRRKALNDTQRGLTSRRLLRWVRRVCTLGLWCKLAQWRKLFLTAQSTQ